MKRIKYDRRLRNCCQVSDNRLYALNNAENEYTNTKSAFDIEKEMKEEKQKELESQEYEEYLKEQQRKEFYNSYSK